VSDQERYLRAAHCMQAGVKLDFARRGFPDGDEHVQVRVGINSALVDTGAIAKLLIDKGHFSQAEYLNAIADAMEIEVHKHEAELTKAYGTKITLVGRLGGIGDETRTS
jgi:hypothetical protein